MDSVLNFEERGLGGNASYRGNCSPKVIEELLKFYKPSSISDYMVGSGTTKDVADRYKLPANTYDLHSGFNLLTDDIPEKNEFIFWHPPYHDMVRYAGKMYSADEVFKRYGYNPNRYDLSQCRSWNEFIDKLNFCMLKQFDSLEKGGHMAVLMGDLKRQGKLYSMLLDIAKPGTVENIVIKMQHNCMSSRNTYTGKPFIRIVHEYILLIKKECGLYYDFSHTQTKHVDIRDSKHATWKDVLVAVIENSEQKEVPLQSIYSMVEGHEKCKSNRYWKEKVRQTLYLNQTIFLKSDNNGWCVRKSKKFLEFL